MVLGNRGKGICNGEKSGRTGKENYTEDNGSFFASSVIYCTIGGHQDSMAVITTLLE